MEWSALEEIMGKEVMAKRFMDKDGPSKVGCVNFWDIGDLEHVLSVHIVTCWTLWFTNMIATHLSTQTIPTEHFHEGGSN